MHTLLFLFRPEAIIEFGGLALLLLIVFAETGLFFGFFLPGDSLLFVAGILCDTQYIALPVWLLIGLVIVAAVFGTTVGYGFGHWAKRHLDNRKENFFYRRRYMEVTHQFYQRYGMYSFVLGRFLPVVRTFVPILAGAVRLDFRNFFFFNVIGAVAWAAPVILAGYWLGGRFPEITEHLDIIISGMFLISGLPIVLSWWRYKRSLGTN